MLYNNNLIDDIYNSTKEFSCPKIFDINSDIVLPNIIDIHELLLNCKMEKSRARLSNIRLYVNGRRKERFQEKKFLADIPDLKQDIITWLYQYFGSDEFLLFINFAGGWSDSLLNKNAKITSHYFQNNPPSTVSFENHVIIGRYFQTPFGVHLDDVVDRVIHFNLGPGDKNIILWDPECYLEKTGGYDFKDNYLPIQDCGKQYNFMKNQGFFLPSNYFHIGQSVNDISICTAIALSKLLPKDIINGILHELSLEINKQQKICSTTDFRLNQIEADVFNCIESHFNKMPNLIKLSRDRYLARLKSNAGYTDKVILRNSHEINNITLAKRAETFKPILNIYQSHLDIFSLGRLLTIPNVENIDKITEIINSDTFCITPTSSEHKLTSSQKYFNNIKKWLVKTKCYYAEEKENEKI